MGQSSKPQRGIMGRALEGESEPLGSLTTWLCHLSQCIHISRPIHSSLKLES